MMMLRVDAASSYTWHTHTYVSNFNDGHWASARPRAVSVVRLVSIAESRTERLHVPLTASNSRHCVARTPQTKHFNSFIQL